MSEETHTVQLRIEKVVYRGKGLARLDGRVVFVEGALPGEVVTVRVDRWHKRYADAHLVEVLEASPARIEPACPLALRPEEEQASSIPCPGCSYQHVDYATELDMKHRQFLNFLEQRVHVDTGACAAPVGAPHPLGYRNKIVLHASPGPCLGYYTADNRTVLDVPACPLAVPAINGALSDLRADNAFMGGLGPKDSVTLRHTASDGVVSWKQGPRRKPRHSPTPVRRLTETTVFGPLHVPTRSFFQVNPPVADLLGEAVSEAIRDLQPEAVVDLYCGSGFLTLAAAQAGVPRVYGVERDGAAAGAARRNLRRHGSARFFVGDAVTGLQRLARHVSGSSTVLVLDPTRRGLEPPLIDLIKDVAPRAILYVSCAPDTLARDLTAFLPLGYAFSRGCLFDMFPRTAHFESLSVLRSSP